MKERTTITLDPDVRSLVERSMRERGVTFKQAVNQAIRDGLAVGRGSGRFRTPSRDLGMDPNVDWDRAHSLAGELEDVEIARQMRQRK